MRAKITGQLMASLEGPFELWDEKLQGLSARRQTDGGRITYRFRYVNGEGRKVNVVVGDASAFKTPDEARKEAKLIAGQAESARRGGRPDPAAERDASRRLPTLGEMWADYEAAGLGRLRASTATLHRQLWRAHIAPRFASMRIDCLSSAEIERWHAETSLAKAAPIAERRAVFRRRGGPDIAGRAARLLRRLQAASAPGAPLCETWAAHMQIIAGHSRFARARAEHLWAAYIAPRFAAVPASAIQPAEIEAMVAAIAELGAAPPPAQARRAWGNATRRGGPVTANRAKRLLSLLCRRGVRDGLIARNPCTAVADNPEHARDIRFADAELALIARALASEAEDVQIAFSLLLETPARHGNVVAAEWGEFVDLASEAPLWRLPASKTKGGRPYETHISPELGQRIAAYREKLRGLSPVYLFPREDRDLCGRGVRRTIDPTRPRASLQSAWRRIKARALRLAGTAAADCRGLALGTIHTFKHTYLSAIADLGASAAELQQMGDHADIATSMIYVNGARARVRDLARQRRELLPRLVA